MGINQGLEKKVIEKKVLLMAFDEESLYTSTMVDKDLNYLRIEKGSLFTPNKPQDFTNQCF